MSSNLNKENIARTVQTDENVEPHDLMHRKKIGAFYTPLNVSTILSNWGIRSSVDSVLEPCFGGCTFLEAATSRLINLGAREPHDNIFGCDNDPLAFTYLKKRNEQRNVSEHFFQQDFLTLSPSQLKVNEVDLVIGNPPYIRHSNFSKRQREVICEWAKEEKFVVSGRTNLWAYFLLHAMHFLKKGGRMAFVLPGSFLYADYAQKIRSYISSKFQSVLAITLAERVFISEGAEETTVILLAEGFGTPSKVEDLRVTCVDSVDDLEILIENHKRHLSLPMPTYSGHGMVPFEVAEAHRILRSKAGMIALGDIAKVRIGLVTGDTNYFVKSKLEWDDLDIGARYLKYILPRSQFVRGMLIDTANASEHIRANIRCLALWTPAAPRQKSLVNYLNKYSILDRRKNLTFGKRKIWHQFNDDHNIPDAFFVFMTGHGPRIILNQIGAISTNSVYRIFFNEDFSDSKKKLIALSMQSTFTQLAAEIIGHPRGSGALKLEPSNVISLGLYLPDDRSPSEIDAAFNSINEKLVFGDFEGARLIADEFLFSESDIAASLPVLRLGLATVRRRRTRRL